MHETLSHGDFIMSRINTPALDTATGATAEVFAAIKKAVGAVPNAYAAIGALTPTALQAYLATDGVLANGTLDKKDIETIRIVTSQATGCDYCLTAHTVVGKMVGLPLDTLRQLNAGQPIGDAKRDALAAFVRILVETTGTITDAQFAAIKAAGYTEVQLAEISLTIAQILFTNIFNRINDTDIDFPEVV